MGVRVRLHIERLVLEAGTAADRDAAGRLARAMERALADRLERDGVPPAASTARHVATADPGGATIAGASEAAVAAELAAAVYRSLERLDR